MKVYILAVLIMLSFVSCEGQTQQRLNEATAKAIELQVTLDSVQIAYTTEVQQYNDTIYQLHNQIEGLQLLLQDCPDSALVRKLQYQVHTLEVQVANMQIQEQKSQEIMSKFQALLDEWAEVRATIYPKVDSLLKSDREVK